MVGLECPVRVPGTTGGNSVKFAFAQLVESHRVTASAFLVALIAAVPCRIHTILTDNGIRFRFPPPYANGPTARVITHMRAMRGRETGIEHGFTKSNHPWTAGQVERMNRTIKDATVRRYHDDHDPLECHLGDFLAAYNLGGASNGCAASHPTSSSVKPGRLSPNASRSIRSTKCRD